MDDRYNAGLVAQAAHADHLNVGSKSKERGIYSLPFEILVEVFHSLFKSIQSSPSDDTLQTVVETHFNTFRIPIPGVDHPTGLQMVSSRFRNALLGAGEYWSSICGTQYRQCTPHPDLIDRWIEVGASTKVPLHLRLAPPLFSCAHPGRRTGSAIDEYTEEILDSFTRRDVMERWEGISFVFSTAMADMFLEAFPDERADTSRLKIVEFDTLDCPPEVAWELFASLTTLNIEAFSWHGPHGFVATDLHVNLPRLRKLHVKGERFEEIEEALRAIEGADELDEVHIEFTRQTSNMMITLQAREKIECLLRVMQFWGKKPKTVEVIVPNNTVWEGVEWSEWATGCGRLGVTYLRVLGAERPAANVRAELEARGRIVTDTPSSIVIQV